MKIKLLSSGLAISLFSSVTLGATSLITPSLTLIHVKLRNGKTEVIGLTHVRLSHAMRKKLGLNMAALLANPTLSDIQHGALPASHYVGMNRQLVLNQGLWGSCVTFAVTGAINALFNYQSQARLSQLCNLQVGRSPGNPYNPSWGGGGWNGNNGNNVFHQIDDFGFMNLAAQKAYGCGGLREYPTYSVKNGTPMQLNEFMRYSNIGIFTHKNWTTLLPPSNPLAPAKAAVILHKVKLALNKGNRIVFGMLMDSNFGFSTGAVGRYKSPYQSPLMTDTWVLNSQIQKDISNNTASINGHDIIIDGYDNNACATYTAQNGTVKHQCGLLRIRNSWGPLAGDKGDYYMTYQYFMAAVDEAYVVGQNVKAS